MNTPDNYARALGYAEAIKGAPSQSMVKRLNAMHEPTLAEALLAAEEILRQAQEVADFVQRHTLFFDYPDTVINDIVEANKGNPVWEAAQVQKKMRALLALLKARK
jgi:hypothetical protein